MKTRPENRKALARPEFGAVTTVGKAVPTNLKGHDQGKHSKGRTSPYNRKRKRK